MKLVAEADGVCVSAATRSGLLFGVFAFFSNLGLGVLFPICAPLCGILWGIGAGLAAVAWSGPENDNAPPMRAGAMAGGLAGVGGLLGLVIGIVLQFTLLGGQELASDFSADLNREFGLESTPGEYEGTFQWIGVSGLACCLGFASLAIMAAAGAGGASIYASRSGAKTGNQAI